MYGMKWLIVVLLAVAALLSGYSLYKTKQLEAATKLRIQLIAMAAR